MKFALVADIHANLQAWNATLLDIRSNDVDQIISLGDIVGYGPNPSETLNSAYRNIDHFILGNHDAAVCGKIEPSMFNEHARNIVEWTKSQLNEQAMDFLNSMPLSVKSSQFRCAHSDFSDPSAFNYIISAHDARPSWRTVPEQILFVGHTHEPAIFVLDANDIIHHAHIYDFVMEPDMRYVVNIGSVGQPRDSDARACYCIFDSDQKSVRWRRIPFDIDGYVEAMEAANLPIKPTSFLKHDPRRQTQPLREMLDFSPAQNDQETVHNVVEVQDIGELRGKVDKLKNICFSLTVAGIIALATAIGAFSYFSMKPLDMDYNIETKAATIDSITVPVWHVHLNNRWRQSIGTENDYDNVPVLIINNLSGRHGVDISTPELACTEDAKFSMEAIFQKGEDFAGNICLAADITKTINGRNEVIEKYALKEPTIARKDGWMQAKHTFTVPANASGITFRITGTFKGQVKIRDICLTRK